MKTISTMAILAMALSSASYAAPARFVVTAQNVAQALTKTGLVITDGQITMLAQVAAAEQDPQLNLLSAEPAHGLAGESNGSLAKLGCRKSGACLPFYVLIDCPAETPSGAVTVRSSQPAKAAQIKVRQAIVIRAGAHAVLEMDSPRAQIRVDVVSLENGAEGKTIRVASLDRKEIYEGEVVGPNLLKGSF